MPVDQGTFQAVRQRVIESAPKGLSKEQFNALLDSEIAKTSQTKKADAAGTWETRGMVTQWHPAGGDPSADRPDSAMLRVGGVGIDPEVVVGSGLGLARAITGGVGLSGKAVEAGKEAVSQVTPVVKYEVAKHALTYMGLPAPLAATIAMGISGYRVKGKAPTAANPAVAAEETAATVAAEAPAVRAAAGPVSPVASAPASPAPPTAPVVRASAPVSTPELPPSSPVAPRQAMSPQRIKNEVMLAARRQKLTLSDAEYQAADALVQQGQTPLEAVQAIRTGGTPASSRVAAAASPAAPAKLKLSYSELNEYHRLTKGGMSHADAAKLIETQRALLKTFGTPSTEDVIRSVVDRNTSGTWKK